MDHDRDNMLPPSRQLLLHGLGACALALPVPALLWWWLADAVDPQVRALALLASTCLLLAGYLYSARRGFRTGTRTVHEAVRAAANGEGGAIASSVFGDDRQLVAEITSQLHVGTDLRRLHQRNQLLLDSAGEGIYGVDREGHCTFANHAAAQMLGYSVDELLGADMHKLVHHSDADGQPRDPALWPVRQVMELGSGMRVRDEMLWSSGGSGFHAAYSSQPIVEDGEVRGAVVVFQDITESLDMARQLHWQASHDSLTGLANRHEFERRVDALLERSEGEHCLLFLDLDQFKVVNDSCGHAAGDELLRQLGELLGRVLRRGDLLARLGGDEFGVLLADCPMSDARRIADNLRQVAEAYRLPWDGQLFAVGVSIGAVPLRAGENSLNEVLRAADAACYAAKEAGRNRIHEFAPDDAELAERQGEMRWVQRLHDAFEHDRLRLYAQPIVAVEQASGIPHHFEVLVRLLDDDGSLVSPGRFMPVAERYKLMPQLDRWVIGNCLEWLSAHPQVLQRLQMVAINLSGATVTDTEFRTYLATQIEFGQIPPEKLCFEITETTAISDLDRAAGFISELKTLGCRFALDDFGSGMSSFGYLKRLPVDYVKIDGSFVRDMCNDPIDRAMVKSINEIGHVMGKQTVAEFVEDEAVIDALRELGVDYAQGYGIAAPAPLAEMLLAATGSDEHDAIQRAGNG